MQIIGIIAAILFARMSLSFFVPKIWNGATDLAQLLLLGVWSGVIYVWAPIVLSYGLGH